jgi:isopenicillin-N N-acyltransferase-like protein
MPHLGTIAPQHVKDALFDNFQTPYSVCRPPRPSATSSEGQTASVAMVVMQPSLGIMEVCPLPALNREFTAYRVGVDRAATRQAA